MSLRVFESGELLGVSDFIGYRVMQLPSGAVDRVRLIEHAVTLRPGAADVSVFYDHEYSNAEAFPTAALNDTGMIHLSLQEPGAGWLANKRTSTARRSKHLRLASELRY